MIFVTVGTHEQPFDRLIAEMDRLKRTGIISSEVVMQIGYSQVVPAACNYQAMMGYLEMEAFMQTADIVITHGGPGSIFGALKQSKIPIVVPRRALFNEHVDDHQVEFARHLQRRGNILPVHEIEDLEDTILHYREYAERLGGMNRTEDGPAAFVRQLDRVVAELLGSRA